MGADNAAARKLCPWRRAERLREPLCRCEKAGQSVKTRKTERLRSQTGSIKKKKRVRSGDRKALTFQCCSGVLHTLRILTCVVGFHYGPTHFAVMCLHLFQKHPPVAVGQVRVPAWFVRRAVQRRGSDAAPCASTNLKARFNTLATQFAVCILQKVIFLCAAITTAADPDAFGNTL